MAHPPGSTGLLSRWLSFRTSPASLTESGILLLPTGCQACFPPFPELEKPQLPGCNTASFHQRLLLTLSLSLFLFFSFGRPDSPVHRLFSVASCFQAARCSSMNCWGLGRGPSTLGSVMYIWWERAMFQQHHECEREKDCFSLLHFQLGISPHSLQGL